MRANEFINDPVSEDKTVAVTIPISITIPSGEKEVTVVQTAQPITEPADDDTTDTTPGVDPTEIEPVELPAEGPSRSNIDDQPDDEKITMVPPLQQELEVDKAAVGKQSQVIDTILDDPDSEEESPKPLSYR